jgi:hypothetical protein
VKVILLKQLKFSTEAHEVSLARCSQRDVSRPSIDQVFLLFNLAFYSHKVAEAAATRRRRMIAGAAAGTAVPSVGATLAAGGPPPGDPETGTLLVQSPGPGAHRLPAPWLQLPTSRPRSVRGSGITRPRARR